MRHPKNKEGKHVAIIVFFMCIRSCSTFEWILLVVVFSSSNGHIKRRSFFSLLGYLVNFWGAPLENMIKCMFYCKTREKKCNQH